MMLGRKTKRVALHLYADTVKPLKAEAKKADTSYAEIVRRLVDNFLGAQSFHKPRSVERHNSLITKGKDQ